MDTLAIIEGIQEAIKTLRTANRATAGGASAIWSIVYHAENHLDKQIRELLQA